MRFNPRLPPATKALGLREFWTDQDGAVTVDWVVLSAAVVGLGIASIAAVRSGVADLGGEIASSLSGATVAALGELGDAAAAAWSYTPLNDRKWSVRLTDMRATMAGATTSDYTAAFDNLLQMTVDMGGAPGTVDYGLRDEYAAIQIVMEENGITLPDGYPDMRSF